MTVKIPSTAPTGISVTNNDECVGVSKTLTVQGGSLGDGATWEWYSDAGFTVSEGSGVSIVVDPAANTTYYVRAEGDCNNTAAASQLVTVKIFSIDPTGINITNDDECVGVSKTLTVQGGSLGDGATWEWYSDAGFTVSEGSGASIVVDPAANTTYYVRAEGDCNNTAAVSQLVTVKVLSTDPTGINLTNDNTCQGTGKTLTVQGGSLGDGATWEWYSDAGFTVSEGSGASIVVDPAASTTYYVRAEGDCNNTAAASQLVTVKVLSTGPTGISITNDNTCQGTGKTLTVQGGSLGDGADWYWYSDSALSVAVANGVTINVDPALTATYFVRAEGDCNVTDSVFQLVTVKTGSTAPSGITVLEDSTCLGTPKTLTVVDGILGDGATWEWYSDAGFTVSEGSGVSIVVDPVVNTTYYIRAEGDCNITAAVSQLVTVLTGSIDPTGISLNNDNSCQGVSKVLSVTGGMLGEGADWFWYSDPLFTIIEGTGVSITVDPAVNTTYYLRAEGICDTTSVLSQLVTVKVPSVKPDTTFVNIPEFCSGTVDSITLSYSGGLLGAGAEAFWYTDTLISDTAFASGNDITIAAPLDTTTYFVRFEGECDTTAVVQVVVIVNPIPSPLVGGSDTVCVPSQVEYSVAGYSGSSFNWNATGGNILGSSTGPNVRIEWTDEGSGILEVTETSLSGCIGTMDTVIVKYLSPTASTIEGGAAVICAGDSGIIYYVNGLNNSTFSWSVEGGNISRELGDSIVVDWSVVPGSYSIAVQETSEFGCTGSPIDLIVDVSGPALDLGGDTYICEGELFTVSPAGTFSAYLWQDGSTASEFSTSMEGRIRVVVEDQFGCMAADSLYLTVNSLPWVDLGPDSSLCGDVGVVLDAGSDGIVFRWSTGDNTQEITVFQGARQEIWVEVEDEFGCISMDTVIMEECNPEFYFRDIPTAITPNNDGFNDTWVIDKLASYTRAEIEIFSRWGTLVWRSEPGYSVPWDGTDMNGRDVPMDSYHFVIMLKVGIIDRITGIVTVIR